MKELRVLKPDNRASHCYSATEICADYYRLEYLNQIMGIKLFFLCMLPVLSLHHVSFVHAANSTLYIPQLRAKAVAICHTMQKELQNKLTRVESPDGFTGLLELSQDEIRFSGK